MHLGHPRLFHASISLLNWYKVACMGNILHRLIWMKFISMLSMHVQSGSHAFSFKNCCGFKTKFYCSDVWGYHRCPRTLAEICRNMVICCCFRVVVARENARVHLNKCWWKPLIKTFIFCLLHINTPQSYFSPRYYKYEFNPVLCSTHVTIVLYEMLRVITRVVCVGVSQLSHIASEQSLSYIEYDRLSI